jgi:hypothetical protein
MSNSGARDAIGVTLFLAADGLAILILLAGQEN